MMNVLERFKYCPVCGSSHFETNSEKSKLCRSCGFEYFINPSAATAAFIMNERGELLVERRKREPAKGMLDLPGGFCDMDENIVQGLRREVREETGLKVVSERFVMSCSNVYLYSGVEIPTMDLFFECEVTAGEEPVAMDDAAECMWIPLREIRIEQFGLRSVRQALYEFIEQKSKN